VVDPPAYAVVLTSLPQFSVTHRRTQPGSSRQQKKGYPFPGSNRTLHESTRNNSNWEFLFVLLRVISWIVSGEGRPSQGLGPGQAAEKLRTIF